MEITDQVYVIKEFIYNGNRYAPSKRPYLYGELPVSTRDNRSFVIPANEVEITSVVPSTNVTRISGNTDETVISKETITRKLIEPQIEEVVETPVVNVDNSEIITPETKVVRKSRKTTPETAE